MQLHVSSGAASGSSSAPHLFFGEALKRKWAYCFGPKTDSHVDPPPRGSSSHPFSVDPEESILQPSPEATTSFRKMSSIRDSANSMKVQGVFLGPFRLAEMEQMFRQIPLSAACQIRLLHMRGHYPLKKVWPQWDQVFRLPPDVLALGMQAVARRVGTKSLGKKYEGLGRRFVNPATGRLELCLRPCEQVVGEWYYGEWGQNHISVTMSGEDAIFSQTLPETGETFRCPLYEQEGGWVIGDIEPGRIALRLKEGTPYLETKFQPLMNKPADAGMEETKTFAGDGKWSKSIFSFPPFFYE